MRIPTKNLLSHNPYSFVSSTSQGFNGRPCISKRKERTYEKRVTHRIGRVQNRKMIRQEVIFCSMFEFEWLGYSYSNNAEVDRKTGMEEDGRRKRSVGNICAGYCSTREKGW